MKKSIDVVDYIVLALILLVSVFIGFYHGFANLIHKKFKRLFGRNKIENEQSLELEETENGSKKAKEVENYIIAGSSIGAFPIACSLLATLYSTTSLLGVPAEVYTYGIQYYITMFGSALPALIGAFLTGPMFAKLNVLSVFEYLEIRFDSKRVRNVGTFCFMLKNFISSSIFMYAPATALSALTRIDENLSIAIIGIIGTFYTSIGGIKGVIWNDFYQLFIMLSTMLLIFIKGVVAIGGFDNLFRISSEGGRLNFFDFNPDPFIRQSFWSLFFGGFMLTSIDLCFDQHMMQRFRAAKSKKVAQRAILLNMPGDFIVVTLLCLVGLVVYANNYSCDPLTTPVDPIDNSNQLVGYFVMNNLSSIPGAAGLFLGSIFCGSLSSVSSSLNSLSAVIWQDVFKSFKYFRSFNDSKSVTTNKIIVVLCGLICAGLAFFISTLGGNILQISLSLNGAFNAPIIGLFILGFFFSMTNPTGVICGTITGLGASLWLTLGAFIVDPSYPKLNVSIAECPLNLIDQYSTSTYQTTILEQSMNTELSGFNRFYALSYMWYATFGALVTVIIGLIASFITCGYRDRKKSIEILLFLTCFVAFQKIIHSNELTVKPKIIK